MEYLIAKWLHISSATLMVGVGIGSAFYLLMAYRHGEPTVFHPVAA